MTRLHCRKLFLTTIAVVIALVSFNFITTVLRDTFGNIAPCLGNLHIKVNKSGNVDRTSRWRKLGLATYVFTAYLDDREPCSAVVTILGFGEKSEAPLYGTLRYNGLPIYLGVYREKRTLNPSGHYTLSKLGPYAYIWTLPTQITNGSLLKSIEVEQTHAVTGRTKAEIPITLPVYTTKTFGVCIDSPLFGPVKPLTIVEYIEINKVLGAELFTFYMYTAEQTALEVLRDYAREGTVEVVLKWGNGFPEQSTHYFGQTLSINECAYRNMYRVKYLVYTDLDEFIVPKKSLTWSAMMAKIEDPKYGTYLFRNSYFFPKENDTRSSEAEFTCNATYPAKLPNFFTHVIRSQKINPAKEKSKYITKPLFTSVVGVHEIFAHVENFIQSYKVPPDFALLHHYRSFSGGLHTVAPSVVEDVKRNKLIMDERAFVYKKKIIRALRRRLCPPPIGKERTDK